MDPPEPPEPALDLDMYTAGVNGNLSKDRRVDFGQLFEMSRPQWAGGQPHWHKLHTLTAFWLGQNSRHPLNPVGPPLAIGDDLALSGAGLIAYRDTVGMWTKAVVQVDHSVGGGGKVRKATVELFPNGQMIVKGKPANGDPAVEAAALAMLIRGYTRVHVPEARPEDVVYTMKSYTAKLGFCMNEFSFMVPAVRDFVTSAATKKGFGVVCNTAGSSQSKLRSIEINTDKCRCVVWNQGVIVVTTPVKGRGLVAETAEVRATVLDISGIMWEGVNRHYIVQKNPAAQKLSLRGRNGPMLAGKCMSDFSSKEVSAMLEECGIPVVMPPSGKTWRTHGKKAWMFYQVCKARGVPCETPTIDGFLRDIPGHEGAPEQSPPETQEPKRLRTIEIMKYP